MTIKELLERSVEQQGTAVALRHKQGGEWREITYAEFLTRVRQAAELLGRAGVEPGDRVALFHENAVVWPVIYFGIVGLGATAVPIDAKLKQQEVAHILRDAEAKVLLAAARLYPTIREAQPHLPHLETVVLIGGQDVAPGGEDGETTYLDYDSELAGVQDAAASDARAYDRSNPEPDDPASFIYTSGTTGRQKGAMVSHANFCANVEACQRAFSVRDTDSFLLVLPLHHAFAFTANLLLPIASGSEISFVESLRTVGENIREISPTALIGVPLLVEKMYARIVKGLQEKKVASAMLAVGLLGPIRKAIRKKLGGNLRIIVTGGAPCDPEVLRGFERLGVPILEGYGLTETSPVLSLNPLGAPKPGTVGVALDNVEIEIDNPDMDGVGEIKARGPNIMTGYFNNPEATAATFQDGWFMTGDLGHIDAEGYITITGRKKSLIVNREGKNIYPEEVEGQVNRGEFILESLVLGYREQRQSVGERVGVIVVPDQDAVDAESAQRGQKLTDQEITELLTNEVRTLSRELSEFKRPRKVHVRMGEFEKTSTGKVKRYLYELEATEVGD